VSTSLIQALSIGRAESRLWKWSLFNLRLLHWHSALSDHDVCISELPWPKLWCNYVIFSTMSKIPLFIKNEWLSQEQISSHFQVGEWNSFQQATVSFFIEISVTFTFASSTGSMCSLQLCRPDRTGSIYSALKLICTIEIKGNHTCQQFKSILCHLQMSYDFEYRWLLEKKIEMLAQIETLDWLLQCPGFTTSWDDGVGLHLSFFEAMHPASGFTRIKGLKNHSKDEGKMRAVPGMRRILRRCFTEMTQS
jgi:hypothetical protein